jgi:hypothetical protein
LRVYRVVVVRDGGLRDVLAEFTSRERAERFIEQVRAIDRDVRLEIVEARDEYLQLYIKPCRAILAVVVLIVQSIILMQMVRALSRGGGGVV